MHLITDTREALDEARLRASAWLLRWAVRIAPKGNPQSEILRDLVHEHADRISDFVGRSTPDKHTVHTDD